MWPKTIREYQKIRKISLNLSIKRKCRKILISTLCRMTLLQLRAAETLRQYLAQFSSLKSWLLERILQKPEFNYSIMLQNQKNDMQLADSWRYLLFNPDLPAQSHGLYLVLATRRTYCLIYVISELS